MTDLVKSRRAFLLGSLLAGVACLAGADEALAAVTHPRRHRRIRHKYWNAPAKKPHHHPPPSASCRNKSGVAQIVDRRPGWRADRRKRAAFRRRWRGWWWWRRRRRW